jgi:predicted nucleic acid-binding Zn ribbon protein
MNKAGDLLGRVARKLNRPEAALAWLSGSWAQIVGKTLAGHTRPLHCEKGRLEIAADAKWHNQLEHMSEDFRARINEAWGGTLIREVKFMATKRGVGTAECAHADGDGTGNHKSKPGLRRLPYELDNEHTPFIRRRT